MRGARLLVLLLLASGTLQRATSQAPGGEATETSAGYDAHEQASDDVVAGAGAAVGEGGGLVHRGEALLHSLETGALETAAQDARGDFDDKLLSEQAKLETVARMDDGQKQKEDVARLIDSHSNKFVLSAAGAGLANSMSLLEDVRLIQDLTVVALASAAGGWCAALAGQPPLLGYLAAGAAVGPGGLSLVEEVVQIETIGALGCLLLLFGLGAELDARRLGGLGARAAFATIIQIAALLGGGAAAARLAGAPGAQGAFAAAVLFQSSTTLTVRCLQERRALATPLGELSVALLVVQDVAVGAGLGMLPAIARLRGGGGGAGGGEGMQGGALRAVAVACALLGCAGAGAAHGGVRRLFTRRVGEAATLQLCALCFTAAALAQWAGLSLELGAFAGGLLLSGGGGESERDGGRRRSSPEPVSPATSSDAGPALPPSVRAGHGGGGGSLPALEAVRGLFGAWFSATVGMTMHIGFAWEHKGVLLVSLAALTAAKAALISLSLLLVGVPRPTSLRCGLGLANVGELGFVILSRGRGAGLLTRPLFLLLAGTTALSLWAAPALIGIAARPGGRSALLPVMVGRSARHSYSAARLAAD